MSNTTGRRFYEPVKKIAAGAGFNEWFKFRSMPTAEDVRQIQKLEGSSFEQGYAAAFVLLKKWSFTKLTPKNVDYDPLSDGEELTEEEVEQHYTRERLEVTMDNLMSLPVECTLPLLEAVGEAVNFTTPESPTKNETTS